MIRLNFVPALIAIALALLTSPGATAGDDSLLLRIQDAVGAPGGQAVITLRTYATRPVGQGTICVAMRGANGSPPPLAAFKGARVFSVHNDVIQSVSVHENGDEMIVDVVFMSPSATVNSVDGPVAALFFDVSTDASPGSVTDLTLNTQASFLFDPDGVPVPIQTRGGELEIRHPTAPRELDAEAHLPDVIGQPVMLSLQTNEPFRIASGQIALRYSIRELIGTPKLVNDPRFGEALIKPDGIPGLAILNVLSSDLSFNALPGNIVSIELEPAFLMRDDFEPKVSLDPALTQLFDDDGNSIAIEIDVPVVWRRGAKRAPSDDHKQ